MSQYYLQCRRVPSLRITASVHSVYLTRAAPTAMTYILADTIRRRWNATCRIGYELVVITS